MSEEPKRGRHFFSCLVKGPLGCLAFLLGAAAVTVLLFPLAFGRFTDRELEQWFAEHHEGELDLGDVWLGSIFGTQHVERLILRDPAGDEVLRARLRAPGLERTFVGPVHRFGPVMVDVELLRLVEAADGTTNLERALRPRDPNDMGWTRRFETDLRFEVSIQLTIERLRCARVTGEETRLENLVLSGLLEWGPEATRLSLAGGSAEDAGGGVQARLDLQRSEHERGAPWEVGLELSNAPALLARAVCAAFRPLAGLAGESLDRLSWSQDGRHAEFLLDDEGATLELRGPANDGFVTLDSGSPVRALLPCDSPRTRTWLATLVPPWRSLECDEPGARHELRLAGRWPLDGDWRGIEGALELLLGPARFELEPALAKELAGAVPGELSGTTLALQLRAGVVGFEGVRLPLDAGELRADGLVDLVRGEVDLRVEAPGARVHLGGRPGAPATVPPPSESPDPPADAPPGSG